MINKEGGFYVFPSPCRTGTIWNFKIRRLQLTLNILGGFNFFLLKLLFSQGRALPHVGLVWRGREMFKALEKGGLVAGTMHHLVRQFRKINMGKQQQPHKACPAEQPLSCLGNAHVNEFQPGSVLGEIKVELRADLFFSSGQLPGVAAESLPFQT